MTEAPDEATFDFAARLQVAIVSADTDFGMTLAIRGALAPSAVLLRRASQRRPAVQAALLRANLPSVEEDSGGYSHNLVHRRSLRHRWAPPW